MNEIDMIIYIINYRTILQFNGGPMNEITRK